MNITTIIYHFRYNRRRFLETLLFNNHFEEEDSCRVSETPVCTLTACIVLLRRRIHVMSYDMYPPPP
jgi:hypothetical protein